MIITINLDEIYENLISFISAKSLLILILQLGKFDEIQIILINISSHTHYMTIIFAKTRWIKLTPSILINI